jgi:hypothetical protein
LDPQNEQPRAVLGNLSGGWSNTASAAVEFALQRAMETARASRQEAPTLEQLLLALLDHESVREMFANPSIDTEAIRTSLLNHLEAIRAAPQGPDTARVDPALQNVMRRAAMKNLLSNKREVEPTDVVVAILVEGNSYSARVLSERGLAVDKAESEAMNRFLARQAEQWRRYEELRARIAEENAREPQHKVQIASGVGTGTASKVRPYTLRVTTDDGGREARFKAAVSHDGRLDLYIEATPFEVDLLANRIAALFEAIDSDGRLRVQLIAEIEGQRRTVSGFGGRAGAIFDDRDSLPGQRSGTL